MNVHLNSPRNWRVWRKRWYPKIKRESAYLVIQHTLVTIIWMCYKYFHVNRKLNQWAITEHLSTYRYCDLPYSLIYYLWRLKRRDICCNCTCGEGDIFRTPQIRAGFLGMFVYLATWGCLESSPHSSIPGMATGQLTTWTLHWKQIQSKSILVILKHAESNTMI